jgi:hypothetical protein
MSDFDVYAELSGDTDPGRFWSAGLYRSRDGDGDWQAVELQQLSTPDQVADGHRLGAERLRLPPATGLAVLFQLHELRQAGDQFGDPLRLVMGQARVRDSDCAIGLAIDMRQHNAIRIDDSIPIGYPFDRPELGKAARRHARE